jgi:hypothetical protein
VSEGGIEQKKPFKLPWHLLVFDVVGAIFVACGLYQYTSVGKGMFLIGAGILMMVPLVVYLLNLSQHTKSQQTKK